jgi:hypothetical protein
LPDPTTMRSYFSFSSMSQLTNGNNPGSVAPFLLVS